MIRAGFPRTGIALVWREGGTPWYECRFNTGLGDMEIDSVLVSCATPVDVDDFYIGGLSGGGTNYPYQVRRSPNVNFEFIQTMN